MRLVSYLKEGHDQLAFLVNDMVYDADAVHPELSVTVNVYVPLFAPEADPMNGFSALELNPGPLHRYPIRLGSPLVFPNKFKEDPEHTGLLFDGAETGGFNIVTVTRVLEGLRQLPFAPSA